MNPANEQIMHPAHSAGKWGARISMASIEVLFVITPPLQLQIKNAMKTLAPPPGKPVLPSLFQIAARIEIPALPRVFRTSPIVGGKSDPADDDRDKNAAQIARNENQRQKN